MRESDTDDGSWSHAKTVQWEDWLEASGLLTQLGTARRLASRGGTVNLSHALHITGRNARDIDHVSPFCTLRVALSTNTCRHLVVGSFGVEELDLDCLGKPPVYKVRRPKIGLASP